MPKWMARDSPAADHAAIRRTAPDAGRRAHDAAMAGAPDGYLNALSNAYFSASISLCVRTPSRRNTGSGGHHPWMPC